ncbi:TetR/AcrR family transcriptional regulator [Saccharothrix sp. ALI-22-I]|uniref:TetR/AcrR family transcriptional regulator n=1 Tax=Saccharothrix sp. ALI-22-I TaxID=1933778 RepID=UPI001179EDEE|nr:TetR family transcriptional regulator [Saccharothrix sp. ALI-22-I]
MGRPPVADRDAIVRAALEIGFSRLTVSAVGERLGISHSTLYRYFKSRDELAAAVVDHAVQAIEWPLPADGWRSFLTETAWAHWRLHDAHPGLAREITALRLTSPALVRRDNETGVHLLGFGFSPEAAMLVVDMLAELVVQEFLATPPDGEGASLDASQRRRRELIDPWLDLYDPRLRPVLLGAVSGSATAWFERKLALFLDGVAARQG